MVIAQRQRIIEQTDNKDDKDGVLDDEDPDIGTVATMQGPSSEALSKMTDYRELWYEFAPPPY